MPDENSLRAGELVCETLSRCTERTLVVACISGGASALLIAPQPGISLAALRAINDALLRSGADIREMNAVRSRLDRLKGGGLARLAAPGQIAGLILSDVVGDPLDVIASGLTNDPRSHNVLVANNAQACEAAADAARGAGYETTIVTTTFSGEARERGREIALAVSASPRPHPQPQPQPRPLPSFGYAEDLSLAERGLCLIYGGETTVTVRGSGKGGRNQELALAAAIELGKGRPYAVIAAVGTDGTDGPTDAAGAVAYPDTLDRSLRLGLDAEDHLRRNDSYAFFAALGDLVMTGPTGTNVADIVIALQN